MSVFGQVLDDTRIERGDSQELVAEFVNDWMRTHDIRVELDEIARLTPKKDRERLAPVLQVIHDYLRRRPRDAANWHTGQAAVSKWKKDKSQPTPEKWPAIAQYLGLPLWEVFEMISLERQPRTAPLLAQALEAAKAENRELRAESDNLDAQLAQAERTLRLQEATQARLNARIEELASQLDACTCADARIGV